MKIKITIISIFLLSNLALKSQDLQIGLNFHDVQYWSAGENAFKDQMKQSGEFFAYYDSNWDNEIIDSIPRDIDGYPNQGIPFTKDLGGTIGTKDLYVRKMISADGRLTTGDYVFLYEGNGIVNLLGDVNVTNATANRIEFTCTGSDNIYLEIQQSDISPNHLRNFILIKASDESTYQTEPWKQSFLDRIAPFYSLRFMDWNQANGCTVWDWSQRTSTTYNCQNTKSGVAYEHIIDLANRTHKHVWICVPHMANENYITEMATLFKNNLDPNLHIYLEYSNEVWNWLFDQYAWVQDDFTWLDSKFPHNDLYNSSESVYYNTGLLAKRTFWIWRQVFADDSLRVNRVLACQGGNSWVAEQMIEATGDYYDYLSPDWYFGASEQTNFSAGVDAQEVIDSCRVDFFENRWADNLAHTTLAQQHNKKVICYEGGQHTTANGDESFVGLQAFYDAQIHPAMYELYDDIIDTLKYRQTEMIMAYTLGGGNSPYGSWGHISDVNLIPTMENAPKYMALLDNMPPTTSIKSILNLQKAYIYPNPTKGLINFYISNKNIQQITITDLTGKIIMSKSDISKDETVDISSFKNGIYIIKIQTDNEIFTTKIIKE